MIPRARLKIGDKSSRPDNHTFNAWSVVTLVESKEHKKISLRKKKAKKKMEWEHDVKPFLPSIGATKY